MAVGVVEMYSRSEKGRQYLYTQRVKENSIWPPRRRPKLVKNLEAQLVVSE
jgi:hypothetical protein